MSNWATEATNNESTMNPNLKWNIKIKSIEENLRKLKQEADNMSQKFMWVKQNQGNYEGFQNWIHKMTASCDEITKNMNDLILMIPKNHDMEYVTKNTQMKQISKRVEDQMKHIKNLSSDIQKEMERSYIAKRMAGSVLSETFVSGDIRHSNDSTQQYQMSKLSDPQLQEAEEEQRQCEKLVKDIVQLENMMVQVSEMIVEQGATVDHIHANVEEALGNAIEGEHQLKEAVNHKHSMNKKKLCILIIVIVILLVLALIIGLSVKFG